eukprot:403336043
MHRPVEQYKNLINQHRNFKKQRRLLREQKVYQKAQLEQKRQFEQSLRFAFRELIKNSIVQEIQQEIVRKSHIDSRKSSTDLISQNQEISRNIQSQFDEEFVNGLTNLFKDRKVNDVQVNVQQEPVSYQESSDQSSLESEERELQRNNGGQVQNQQHRQVEPYVEKNESFYDMRVEPYNEKDQSFYDRQNQINQSNFLDNCFKDSMAKVASLQDLNVRAQSQSQSHNLFSIQSNILNQQQSITDNQNTLNNFSITSTNLLSPLQNQHLKSFQPP